MNRTLFAIFLSLIIVGCSRSANEDIYSKYDRFYLLCDDLRITKVEKSKILKKGEQVADHLVFVEMKEYYDLKKSLEKLRVYNRFNIFAIIDNKKKSVIVETKGSFQYDEKNKNYNYINIVISGVDIQKEYHLISNGILKLNNNKWFLSRTVITKEVTKKGKIDEEFYTYEGKCKAIDEKKFDSY